MASIRTPGCHCQPKSLSLRDQLGLVKIMHKHSLLILVILCCAACSREAPPAATTQANSQSDSQSDSQANSQVPANGDFVGKVWINTSPSRPLGSMLIFLPDRTLVMDSCFETYRLSKWGVVGDRIRWLEDSIPIEAAVDMPRKDQLILRVAGQDTAQSFVTASVPYVCPDMSR